MPLVKVNRERRRKKRLALLFLTAFIFIIATSSSYYIGFNKGLKRKILIESTENTDTFKTIPNSKFKKSNIEFTVAIAERGDIGHDVEYRSRQSGKNALICFINKNIPENVQAKMENTIREVPGVQNVKVSANGFGLEKSMIGATVGVKSWNELWKEIEGKIDEILQEP